jgi:hypothetical protein
MLTDENKYPEGMETSHPPKKVKPPPIFLHGVIN